MPQAVNQIYNSEGLLFEEIIPWTKASFRNALAEERWKRETAGIIVGPYTISTMRDISKEIENQKAAWSAFCSEIRARSFQLDMTYKNPETGIPVLLTRDEILRIGDCVAWYVETCFRVEMALYNAADFMDLDTLEAQMRSNIPNNPWPQREFLLVPE